MGPSLTESMTRSGANVRAPTPLASRASALPRDLRRFVGICHPFTSRSYGAACAERARLVAGDVSRLARRRARVVGPAGTVAAPPERDVTASRELAGHR